MRYTFLDDADFDIAVPIAVGVGLGNSGQACLNGTRILIPESRKAEAVAAIKKAEERERSGDPREGHFVPSAPLHHPPYCPLATNSAHSESRGLAQRVQSHI